MCTEDYDEEIDLCLDLLSYKKLEPNLYRLLNMEAHQWINISENILDLPKISHNIEAMWTPSPNFHDDCTILIFFINKDTLEMSHAIYYNYKKLIEKWSCLSE